MRFAAVTLFPEMFEALRCCGITRRALDRELISLDCWNPRDYATDRHNTVDDRPYGGGPGMVMQYQPLADAIDGARLTGNGSAKVIALSPQGRTLDAPGAIELASESELVLVCGRYEGIDERLIEDYVDEEWSIGDYVLSGGEIAAMAIIDAVTRQIPGALGHEDSADEDSFANGLLDYPHYTRPETVNGRAVPAVLLDGNHAVTARWRLKQALGRTWQRRPELLEELNLSNEQTELLNEFISEQGGKRS